MIRPMYLWPIHENILLNNPNSALCEKIHVLRQVSLVGYLPLVLECQYSVKEINQEKTFL